jgi:hypothetical protein
VVVAVMEIGDVRVGMNHRFVAVLVLMSSRERIVMDVIVVSVVVGVFVVVFDRLVRMVVGVVAVQHEADADRGDQEGQNLAGGDGLGEDGPGDYSSDERRGGEHELTSGGAEVACAGDPERDGGAVAERADDERPDDWPPAY